MMFNHRRLSMDSALYRKLEEEAGGRLRAGPDSASLFGGGAYTGPDWLSGAGPLDTCFVENPADLSGVRPDGVLLFRWNRTYPYDASMPGPLLEGMGLERSEEFRGTSHDKMTMEVFRYVEEE